MKKLLITMALLLCTTAAHAAPMTFEKAFVPGASVTVYAHDRMSTRYLTDGCMIKAFRTDVYTGVRGYFTIVNKKKSKFGVSQAGRKYAYIQSTAGKAIIVGSCITASTTLDQAVDIYRDILQMGSSNVGEV